jgi:hypothetical protein
MTQSKVDGYYDIGHVTGGIKRMLVEQSLKLNAYTTRLGILHDEKNRMERYAFEPPIVARSTRLNDGKQDTITEIRGGETAADADVEADEDNLNSAPREWKWIAWRLARGMVNNPKRLGAIKRSLHNWHASFTFVVRSTVQCLKMLPSSNELYY